MEVKRMDMESLIVTLLIVCSFLTSINVLLQGLVIRRLTMKLDKYKAELDERKKQEQKDSTRSIVIGMRDDGIPLRANVNDLLRHQEIMRKPWP